MSSAIGMPKFDTEPVFTCVGNVVSFTLQIFEVSIVYFNCLLVLKSVSQGLYFLHDNGIAHRCSIRFKMYPMC